MFEHFVAMYRKRLKSELDYCSSMLCNNSVPNIEEYRRIAGKINGFNSSLDIFDEVIKTFTSNGLEDKDVISDGF